MKAILNQDEIKEAIQAYVKHTLGSTLEVQEIQVVAGRDSNGSRIEVELITATDVVVTAPTPTKTIETPVVTPVIVPAVVAPVVEELAPPVPDAVQELEQAPVVEPIAETVTPVPSSFFLKKS